MDPSYQAGLDPDDLQKLAAAKRKKILIFVGVVLLPFAYWGMGFSAVQDHLESANFSGVQVSAGSSPFEYKFKAKRGVGETCRGTVTRMPGSMSYQSSCQGFVDVNGRPMERP